MIRLLIVVNDAAFFVSHRLPIAIAALEAGYEVHVATPAGVGVHDVLAAGCIHHEIALSRSGRNIFTELKCFISIWWLFWALKPTLIHLVTVKPVIYGGICARLMRVGGVVAAISGLGHIFDKAKIHKPIESLLRRIYRIALSHPNLRIIFQNPTDREELLTLTGFDKKNTRLIRGSGVDLNVYQARPEPDGVPVVVFASRLLKNKGVADFVSAAYLLKEKGIKARFWLAGPLDPDNPSAITESDLDILRKDSAIEVLGFRKNIPDLFANSHIVTLPSYYREGVPKVLLEAAACGRAIVTTDHPGCRDAIEPQKNGLLVPPRDPVALAHALQTLLEDTPLRQSMGLAGRRLAEAEFSINKIVSAHLDVYQELLNLKKCQRQQVKNA